jgi:glycosyltransferase involved in cell wall biosynthesis
MADHLVTLGAAPDTVHVVHVGTRTDEYDYQLPTGPLHEWLSVGRLVEKKGFADCLRAFRAYRQQVPNATLDVVGDGAQMDKLRALVDGSDLESAVRLLGRRPHSDVLDRMADADAFVLCSKEARNGDREGIPTVLMEAQAIGLPVVATRHSGIPEVIPETNHDLLAPEGDIDAIADRLLRLSGLSDAELRSRSARGREKIEAEFNLPRVVETLRGLYTDCAAERV